MILGIDPGFNGALAWYSPKDKDLVDVRRMPTVEAGGMMLGKSSRREIDACQVTKYLFLAPPTLVVMEKVASSPQMGVTSAFRFGEGFGVLQGVVAAMGYQTRYAYPAVWKAALGLSADKSRSVALAIELFPKWRIKFESGRGCVDMAEAALLAYYGERLLAPAGGPWSDG